jgi:predicted RNase H-like nuclease (RuvC/YqgF family)
MDSAPEDIELELRRLEETHEESERRLKQLTESRLPTEREIEAALTLSKSLPALDIEIRRLRAELAKARATGEAWDGSKPADR